MYEAIFRVSLVRMALEQTSPFARRLRRTGAAKTLDPSEKGAVNYFLGLAVSKLFATKLLATPFLMHLDVFRPQLNTVLAGRSRPDLVGEIPGGKGWIAMECKGRLSVPGETARAKAKQQSLRLTAVNGSSPVLHIGAFAFFRSDVLEFYWEDPPNDGAVKQPIELETRPAMWAHYYAPVLQLMRSKPYYKELISGERLASIEEMDIQIGIHPSVLELLEAEKWDSARHAAVEIGSSSGSGYSLDGVKVVAGPSWFQRFADQQQSRE